MRTATPAGVNRALLVLQGWPRRLAAGLLLSIGLVLLLAGKSHPVGPTSPVVVARTILPAGSVLRSTDLTLAHWPRGTGPPATVAQVADVVGKSLGSPLWPGDAVTTNRLLDTTVAAGLAAGQVAVTVQIIDQSHGTFVQAGSRIDLYATGSAVGATPDPAMAARPAAPPIASDVAVVVVFASQHGSGPLTDGTDANAPSSIVIACDRLTAGRLAAYASGPFVASLRPSQ